MRLPAILGEPLVQFVAIGTMLAAAFALIPEEPGGPEANTAEIIRVGEGRILQLQSLFERTWQRPPTPAELDGLIDSFVREEVLYRAGGDLRLDKDDAVVRRRIAQKMGFLMEPAPGEIEPTKEDLERHLADFPARFRTSPRLTFEQVFIDTLKHEASATAAADQALAALKAGANPAEIGDSTLLPALLENERLENVVRIFGSAFADALLETMPGEWVGPLASPFGVHIIRIGKRLPARDPDIAQVHEAVAADWTAMRRREVAEERFQALKARYTIEIAHPDGAAATSEWNAHLAADPATGAGQ